MAAYLADSSVLLDVFTADPVWADWSVGRLERASADGTVFINPIVYSEISIRFSRIEDLEVAIGDSGLVRSKIPREALFLAGKVYMSYRKAGGHRTTPLPDFFIGAHAAVFRLHSDNTGSQKGPQVLPKGASILPESSLVWTVSSHSP
jgi:predicted nucleic acid-binding protein